MHLLSQPIDLVHLRLLLEGDEMIHLRYNDLLNCDIHSHSQTLKGTEHIVAVELQSLLV